MKIVMDNLHGNTHGSHCKPSFPRLLEVSNMANSIGRLNVNCVRNLGRNLYAVRTSSTSSKGKSSWEPVEKKTHTGQEWEDSDYRLARFVERPKQVNEQFAINLIHEVPPIPKKERVTYCDGGGGPLGHPRVYINLDKPGNHDCGYCGLRFYLEGHGGGGH